MYKKLRIFLLLGVIATVDLSASHKRKPKENVSLVPASETNKKHKSESGNSETVHSNQNEMTMPNRGFEVFKSMPIAIQDIILGYARELELSLVSSIPCFGKVLSHDGRLLASVAPESLKIELWHVPTKRKIKEYQIPAMPLTNDGDENWEDSISKIAFSPDGKYLAARTDYGRTALWNLSSDHHEVCQSDDSTHTTRLEFSPHGNYLVFHGHDGNYEIDGTNIYSIPFKANDEPISVKSANLFEVIAFSANGNFMALSQDKKQIKVLNIAGSKQDDLRGLVESDDFCALSADGYYLATPSEVHQRIDIYKNQSMELYAHYNNILRSNRYASLIPGCNTCLLPDIQKVIVSYLGYEKESLINYLASVQYCCSMAFSPDSKYIACIFMLDGQADSFLSTEDGLSHLFLIERKTGITKWSKKFPICRDLWFASDGRYLITQSEYPGPVGEYYDGEFFDYAIVDVESAKIVKAFDGYRSNFHSTFTSSLSRLSSYVMFPDVTVQNAPKAEIFSLLPSEFEIAVNKARRMKYLKLLLKNHVKQVGLRK